MHAIYEVQCLHTEHGFPADPAQEPFERHARCQALVTFDDTRPIHQRAFCPRHAGLYVPGTRRMTAAQVAEMRTMREAVSVPLSEPAPLTDEERAWVRQQEARRLAEAVIAARGDE